MIRKGPLRPARSAAPRETSDTGRSRGRCDPRLRPRRGEGKRRGARSARSPRGQPAPTRARFPATRQQRAARTQPSQKRSRPSPSTTRVVFNLIAHPSRPSRRESNAAPGRDRWPSPTRRGGVREVRPTFSAAPAQGAALRRRKRPRIPSLAAGGPWGAPVRRHAQAGAGSPASRRQIRPAERRRPRT